MLSIISRMLPFVFYYAECHYTECRYAECRYAECRGVKKYVMVE